MHLVVVTRSWPVTTTACSARLELAEGNCLNLHKPGLTNSNKGHEATARNPTIQVFRKNAEHLMCDLTTGWILEKCPEP